MGSVRIMSFLFLEKSLVQFAFLRTDLLMEIFGFCLLLALLGWEYDLGFSGQALIESRQCDFLLSFS